MTTRTFDTTVLGGLPVTIGYDIAPAEPDIGIRESYVSEWWIEAIDGRPFHKQAQTAWIINRIEAQIGEDNIITEECLKDYHERVRRAYDDA